MSVINIAALLLLYCCIKMNKMFKNYYVAFLNPTFRTLPQSLYYLTNDIGADNF